VKSKFIKNKIDVYSVKQNIQKDENKESNKKTIQKGIFIFEHFNDKFTKLGKIVQDNTDSLNDWNEDVNLYCILKINLKYGVLRPSEIIDCKITDYECEGNHIDILTQQIVINHHKNDQNGTKIIDVDDKKLLGILRKGLGKYIISNQNNELYQSSSAFTKAFNIKLGYNPYDLRKVISSMCMSEGDASSIKNLEHNHGHSLQ
jgi:hypothetical protein